VNVQRDLPAVNGDPQRCRQVFQNLIANPLKFGRDATAGDRSGGKNRRREIPVVVYVRMPGAASRRVSFRDTVFGLSTSWIARTMARAIGMALVRRKIVEFHGAASGWSPGTTGRGRFFISYFTLSSGCGNIRSFASMNGKIS